MEWGTREIESRPLEQEVSRGGGRGAKSERCEERGSKGKEEERESGLVEKGRCAKKKSDSLLMGVGGGWAGFMCRLQKAR